MKIVITIINRNTTLYHRIDKVKRIRARVRVMNLRSRANRILGRKVADRSYSCQLLAEDKDKMRALKWLFDTPRLLQ